MSTLCSPPPLAQTFNPTHSFVSLILHLALVSVSWRESNCLLILHKLALTNSGFAGRFIRRFAEDLGLPISVNPIQRGGIRLVAYRGNPTLIGNRNFTAPFSGEQLLPRCHVNRGGEVC